MQFKSTWVYLSMEIIKKSPLYNVRAFTELLRGLEVGDAVQFDRTASIDSVRSAASREGKKLGRVFKVFQAECQVVRME